MSVTSNHLLSVDQAVALILARSQPPFELDRLGHLPLEYVSGLVLAETIVADIDLPPFDKATMDGYAVRSADLSVPGEHRLRRVATIHAGEISDRVIGSGEAAAIMTGAPLPPGADAVVPVERTRIDSSQPDQVIFDLTSAVGAGQFILERGREVRVGDVLLAAGTTITPAMIGLLASVGWASLRAKGFPSVAIVPTGDELVAPDYSPGPGQIRNSNGPMLAALVQAQSPGWNNTTQVMLPDRADALLAGLDPFLKTKDVLILSGGVSMGEKDLVPATLRELGVEPVFHKVAVKPGKPIWFGVGPRRNHWDEGRPGTLVFGLPGNPASCVVGFLLFVRPALDALAGRGKRPSALEAGRLGADFRHKGDRPTYHPAKFADGVVTPLPWAGSADLRTVALADGFAAFPAGDQDHKLGDPVGFLRL